MKQYEKYVEFMGKIIWNEKIIIEEGQVRLKDWLEYIEMSIIAYEDMMKVEI